MLRVQDLAGDGEEVSGDGRGDSPGLLSLLRQEQGCHGISSIEYRVRPKKAGAKKVAAIKEKKSPPLLRVLVERLKKS